MKNIRLKRLLKSCLPIIAACMSYAGYAQTTIGASIPDQPIAGATQVGHINCDMVECPLQGGVRLSAVVWDEGFSQVCSLFVDYTGNPTPVQVALPPTPSGSSYLPDVIIGNARRVGEQRASHVVGVIYQDAANYDTYYSWYYVTGVGGTLGLTLGGTIRLNGTLSKYPHIDAFADNVNTVGGLPGIYTFAATWEEHFPSGIITTTAIGPIDSPPAGLTTYQVGTGFGGNEMPDVACITDVNTGAQTALFAHMSSGGVRYAEFDVATSSVTTSYMLTMSQAPPRIEAMNLYDPSFMPPLTKYQVVGSTPMGADVEGCNDTYYPLVYGGPLSNANAALFGTSAQYLSPAVAAGIGIGGTPANIGNSMYSIGMYIDGTNYFYGRQLDITTGDFPLIPGGNDYYAINQNPVGGSYRPLGMTSSSNSGFDLLSVWFDGNTIMRKFSGNAFAFKSTTGVRSVDNQVHYTLSPNPAAHTITISGMNKGSYTITDVTGRLLVNGNLNEYKTDINISALAAGTYFVNVLENGNVHTSKFVKE